MGVFGLDHDDECEMNSEACGCQSRKDLTPDAMRYRWLVSTNLGVFMQVGGRIEAGASKKLIDSAIDAAMRFEAKMEIRLYIERPSPDEIHEPFSGIAYHHNGQVMGRVKIQIKTQENNEWVDIPVFSELGN